MRNKEAKRTGSILCICWEFTMLKLT